jgi:hypothetical protein
MVYFQTKNPNLGKFWSVLQRKMLVYFVAIWDIFWLYGIIFPVLVCCMYFMLYLEKSGNPDPQVVITYVLVNW